MRKVFFFLWLSSAAFAQNYVDVLRVYANTTTLNKFDSSNSSTRVNEVYADLTLPIKLNDRTAIITGMVYEGVQVKLFANQNPTNLSGVVIKAGITRKFNEKWSGTLILLPKVVSNIIALNGNDFQVGALGYMKYKKSENLNYRFGFYANTDLFGPLFVPMVGLYYISPNKKFETTLMLPFQADFNYKVASFIHIGLNYNAQVRTFYLNNITPLYNNTYVTKSTDEFFLYAKFNITKSFSLQARIGQSVARDYHVYKTDDKVTLGLPAIYIGDHREKLNTNFANGLIYQAVLAYRLYLPE